MAVRIERVHGREVLDSRGAPTVEVEVELSGGVRGLPLWRSLLDGRTPVLPLPMVNVISGGLHAGRNLDLQDFLVVPVGAATLSGALELVAALYAATGELLAARGLSTLKADEGGFGPVLRGNVEAFELLSLAVERAGLELGGDVTFAIDVAASHLFDPQSS